MSDQEIKEATFRHCKNMQHQRLNYNGRSFTNGAIYARRQYRQNGTKAFCVCTCGYVNSDKCAVKATCHKLAEFKSLLEGEEEM